MTNKNIERAVRTALKAAGIKNKGIYITVQDLDTQISLSVLIRGNRIDKKAVSKIVNSLYLANFVSVQYFEDDIDYAEAEEGEQFDEIMHNRYQKRYQER